MAKRKRRREKKKNIRNQSENNPQAILKLAEKQLSEGNVVRAREGFKRLLKQDPEVYFERFVEVSKLAIGVAISEGKLTQAEQWLDHLKDDLGVDFGQLKTETLKLAASRGDQSAQKELASVMFNSNDEVLRRKGADELVLMQADEAAPICRAIAYLCRAQWDEMRQELQEIGRKSPFAHWRLFLRGCAAYYQNDHTLAQSCFLKLPDETIPAQKSKAFMNWREVKIENVSESVLKQACCLMGEPVEFASALTQSHEFWEKKKYFKAYESMKAAGVSFPTWEVDLVGQITHFFQHAHLTLSYEDRNRWLEVAVKFVGSHRAKSPGDLYALSNVSLHSDEGEYIGAWDIYRENREFLRGPNPVFNALSWMEQASLALILECECEDCLELAHEEAQTHLEKAIAEAPEYEPAYRKLLETYEALDKTSERNKLLDQMSRLFPESPEVLFDAAKLCLERKSYVKGLKYLEKAREAAPLDQKVATEIRRGLLGKAIKHYQAKSASQIKSARATFELLLKEVEHATNLIDSYNLAVLKWAALEEVMVEKKASLKNEKLLLVKEMEPHVVAFLFTLFQEIYNELLNKKRPYKPISLRLKGAKTLEQAIPMVRILLDEVFKKKMMVRMGWLHWLEKYINQSLSKLTKKDRDVAIEMYRLLKNSSHCWDEYPDRLIQKWLKIDKKDPLFSLWKFQNSLEVPTMKELDEIRKEAEKRGDQVALTEVNAYSKRFESIAEEDDFSDEANSHDGFSADEDDGEMDPHEVELLRLMLESMGRKERIKYLMEQGMPKYQAELMSDQFELLNSASKKVKAASKDLVKPKRLPKPQPQPEPKTKPKPKSFLDPNQSEFQF